MKTVLLFLKIFLIGILSFSPLGQICRVCFDALPVKCDVDSLALLTSPEKRHLAPPSGLKSRGFISD